MSKIDIDVAKFFISNRSSTKILKISDKISVVLSRDTCSKYILFANELEYKTKRKFHGQIWLSSGVVRYYAAYDNIDFSNGTSTRCVVADKFLDQMMKIDPVIVEWMIWNPTGQLS